MKNVRMQQLDDGHNTFQSRYLCAVETRLGPMHSTWPRTDLDVSSMALIRSHLFKGWLILVGETSHSFAVFSTNPIYGAKDAPVILCFKRKDV